MPGTMDFGVADHGQSSGSEQTAQIAISSTAPLSTAGSRCSETKWVRRTARALSLETDPVFKKRLMTNATEAIAEMGCPKLEANNLVVVENTPRQHNVVVCTLCSCYPWAVLGIPPTWYKSFEYRARVVREAELISRRQ